MSGVGSSGLRLTKVLSPTDKIISVMAELDCKGLRCPMPIVRIGLAIRQLAIGEQLAVEANDPAFQPDLAAWTRKTGHKLVHFEPGPPQRALIEKVGAP